MTEKLITVASFDGAAQAHIARIQLEAEGVEAYLDNENVAGMLNVPFASAIGEVKLQVRESEVAAAQRILNGQDKSVE